LYKNAIAKEITVRDIDRNYKICMVMEKKHGKKSVYTQEKYNLKKAVTGYFYAV
jgi:hypothetical protein